MKRTAISLIVVGALSIGGPAAFADSIHIGGTENITNEGGAGGSASAAAAAAASAATGPVTQTQTTVVTPIQTTVVAPVQKSTQLQGQEQRLNNKITNTVTVQGDRTEIPAQAPAIFSPNLTSSPEACMGSISGGGGAGFNGISFGFNLGSTWTNQECQDRMNYRTILAGGTEQDRQAAREYLAASNPKVAEAYKRAGVKLAVTEEKGQQVSKVVPAPAPVVEPAATKIEKKDEVQQDESKKVSEVLGEAMRSRQDAAAAGVQS